MAWAALLRVALLPTILWDFLVGLRLAGAWRFEGDLLALTALLCFYHGGMALNDVRDRELDRESGRKRPLVDGRIAFPAAAGVALLLIGGGWLLAQGVSPGLAEAAPWLAAAVVLYDLSSGTLRRSLGPYLLAAARGFSLGWPVLALGGFAAAGRPDVLPALVVYGIYFFSVSRIAQAEETGMRGRIGILYFGTAALVPIVLAYAPEFHLLFLLPWALFGFWLMRPALQAGPGHWDPEQVQKLVRHGLSSGPLLLATCLVALGEGPTDWILAAAAPLVMLAVRRMARVLPPE
jgi:hypothetical protein